MFFNTNFKEQVIKKLDGLNLSEDFFNFIWSILSIFTLLLGITIRVLVLVWLERKKFAGIQQRIGPEHAGPLRIIQALADGVCIHNMLKYFFHINLKHLNYFILYNKFIQIR